MSRALSWGCWGAMEGFLTEGVWSHLPFEKDSPKSIVERAGQEATEEALVVPIQGSVRLAWTKKEVAGHPGVASPQPIFLVVPFVLWQLLR